MPGPVSDVGPSLADIMRNRCAQYPEHTDEILKMADDMDNIDVTNVKSMLGTWARTRRRWSEISGDTIL